MPDTASSLLWTQPAWLQDARTWIAENLAYQGIPVTGPVEQVHVRPWSTILRAPIPESAIYFKAAIPLLAREPGLTQALYRLQPGCIFPVLAVDLERGWMLTPDGGPALRAYLKTPADLVRVEALMPIFARLQIDTIAHLDDLAPHVPFDRRLDRLPGLFEDLLDDKAAMRIDQEMGLTAGQFTRLRALLPRFTDMCARLAAYRIPPALHHDDFHDANVHYVDSGEGAHYIISDWGECCLAHPFFSMLICLRSLGERAGYPDEATDIPEALPPDLARLRDLYLQPWERFETRANLAAAFSLAWRVGMVNRALTWHQVVASLDPALQPDYRYTVPAWLGEFLTLMERDSGMG